MPSLAARGLNLAAWATCYGYRNTTESKVLQSIAKNLEKNSAAYILPSNIGAQEIKLRLLAEQEWQTFEINTATDNNTVAIFWHGGGFINTADRLHSVAIRQLTQIGVTTILPIYDLAPLATSAQMITAGIDLVMSISHDGRFATKDICLMGDSAGGWIACRLYFALLQLCVGDGEEFPGSKDILKKWSREQIKATTARITSVVLFAALLDAVVDTPEDVAAERNDPALRTEMIRTTSTLWAYGPSHYPAAKFVIPEHRQKKSFPTEGPKPSDYPLSHEIHSPMNGARIMARYDDMIPDSSRKIRFVQFCGTADILHVGNARLARSLQALCLKNFDCEFHSYEGMIHVFQGFIFLPEAKEVWKLVANIL